LLYRYEVKSIQAFVLRSSRLRDIAAASALVATGLDRARDALAAPLDGELVLNAAGSATLQFPDAARASRFAELWPLVVGEQLPGAQVIAGLAPSLAALHQALQSARNSPAAPVFDAGPWVARASRSGQPAVAVERRVLQDAVHLRLQEARTDRGLEELLLSGSALRGRRFCVQADRLGPDGYLAMVHADGNGIGQHVVALREGGDIEALRRFSEALRAATVGAVRTALHEVFAGLDPDEAVLPARPVVVGGDDVTLLIQPRYALDFTARYLEAFEARCGQDERLKGLTASAGVVFAKTKAPVFAVHEVCESLCGWVKAETEREVSALALHRISTSALEPLEQTRMRSLSAEGAGDEPLFMGGPYAVGDGVGWPAVTELKELVRACGELPRGGVRQWLKVRQESGSRGAIRWDRLGEVCSSKPSWEVVDRLLERGHWRSSRLSQSIRQRSPLLDVLNLIAVTGGGR